MSRRISKSRADRVGDRLRRAESPDPADLAELQEIIAEYDEPLAEAQHVLRVAGFSATSRLKTELTTLEKLKRENNRLSTIQDIAGLRIVMDMDLDEQDRVTQRIVDLFEGARVLDRRRNPSFGYRAVHIVAQVKGFPVEIQVRTSFQDLWAQAFERFADLVGRGIRYGDVLEEPVSEKGPPRVWEDQHFRRGARDRRKRAASLGTGRRQSHGRGVSKRLRPDVETEISHYPKAAQETEASRGSHIQASRRFATVDAGGRRPIQRGFSQLRYFLITYDRKARRILALKEFSAAQRPVALAERFALERESRDSGNIEVVVLGAASLDELRKTHSRYFEGNAASVKEAG